MFVLKIPSMKKLKISINNEKEIPMKNAIIIEVPVNSLSFVLSFVSAISNPLELKKPNLKKIKINDVIERKNDRTPKPVGPNTFVLIILIIKPKPKAKN